MSLNMKATPRFLNSWLAKLDALGTLGEMQTYKLCKRKGLRLMFKSKIFLIGVFYAGFLCAPVSVSAQTDFNAFWKKFKTAVLNNDQAAVAGLTRFPLEMPFGVRSVTTKAELLKGYDSILNMEANAKRCFQATKPHQEGDGYAIYCTFKQMPESSENRPIRYYFGQTETGWRFEGLDNINE
jgi:hypothetical protein